MKLIVGLGNPGRNYARTRHNVGFRVADVLAEQLGAGFDRSKFKAQYAEASLPRARHWHRPDAAVRGPAEETESEEATLLLVKPQTFMNLSGETVAAFSAYFKISMADVLVVVDDVALPLGQLRLRRGGSDGGHNGLKDISLRLGGKDYARLRVGVGGREVGAEAPAQDLVEHVLSRFTAEEEQKLEVKLELAAEACLSWAQEGIEAAMNKYNAKEKRQDP